MGYYSSIGIAVISTEKDKLDEVKQEFKRSSMYQKHRSESNFLLSLFQEKRHGSYYQLIAMDDCIKWYYEMSKAWYAFSEICNDLNLHWYFVRVGEEYGDIEEYDNSDQFSEDTILLEQEDIFDMTVQLHCLL